MAEHLAQHGHIIHYITTTPSIRTLTYFLQEKKSVQYLEKREIEQKIGKGVHNT